MTSWSAGYVADIGYYTELNPLVADRIKKIKDQNRHYLAHEYFNKDWLPMCGMS